MYRNLLNWLTILLVLPSCSGTSPTISVVCEENNVGNAIIKWETAPILKGQVKVYASTSPDFIPEENPVATINIAKGKKTIVTNDPSQRYYSLMVFNNRYRVTGENRKSVRDGLGSASGGNPCRPPAPLYVFTPCGSLLRCKVTVIYNAVK